MIAEKKRGKRLINMNVRIPQSDRDRIKKLATKLTEDGIKVNESDIVREAVSLFLQQSST